MTKKRKNYGPPNQPSTAVTTPRAAKSAGPTASQRRDAMRAQRRRAKAMRTTLIAGASLAVLAAVIVLAVLASPSARGYNTSTNAWVLPRLGSGQKVSLASLRGKPVVVNMFASWCVICQEELPLFAQEARTLRGKVTFVEVNSLETGNGPGMARQYGLAKAGAIVLADVGGAQNSGLHDALGGGNSMPVTAFYTSTGQLITTHIGGYSQGTLATALQQYYGVH